MAIPHSLQWEIDRIPRNRKITHGPGLSRFAVDVIEPGAAAFPNTIEEVSHLLSAADSDSKAVVPWGGGTAMELGNRAQGCDLVIGTSRLNRVLEYEPSDLTVVVQFLPPDPPMPIELPSRASYRPTPAALSGRNSARSGID